LPESKQKKHIERKRKSQMIAHLRMALILALLGTCWAERPGDFRVIGPGGGGAQYNPTINPHDSNTILISCDMTGAYITHDGGRSWRMFNLRGTVRFFAFDPSAPKTMYAQVTGLWRSTDDGATWKLVYPKASAVRGVRMNSDHADETIVAEPNLLGEIAAMAIDPADSKTLYVAAAGENKQAALFVSKDSGESWQRQAGLPEIPRHIWVDPHSPAGSRILFIAGTHGVAVASASSVENRPAPASVSFTDISMGFLQNTPPVIYATAKQGGFVSNDGGHAWQKCTLPGAGAQVRAVATSLHNPKTAYVSYNNLKLDGKTWMGVAKTADSGGSWTLVWKDSESSAPNVKDAWVDERFGPGWGENPLTLGVADQDPNICYGTDLGRTMRTSDGGATWTAQYSRKDPGAAWTTTGLDVTTSYGVHFDPFDPRRQFITYTDIGLFRSEDAGKSWTGSTEGVPRQWVNTTYWVEFDPQVRGRVWSVNSGTHDLPRPKMWRRNSVLNYKGGVCRSDDGGRTWVKSNTGMDPTAPTHILLDPTSPPDARVLYVAAFGRGVYKSVDGGKSWTLKNNGIRQKEPFAWRLARDGEGALYLVVARRSEDGSIGGAGDGALYKSIDGAETWNAVQLPAGVNGPNGLAIDPKTPQRLYLAAWARAEGMHGEGGGIYLSEDGGKSWRQILDRDRHVYDVTVDARDPNVLYATGFESSAWRSADRGEHWARIPGFNFKWGHRVIPDPADPAGVYVTTFGGSVWHGLVNGSPRAVDIATPEMEPGR
jgi:photosystem II stability/assembly factor-like uncharacterized protein